MKVALEIDCEKLVEHFLGMGIKKVFITMGMDGVAYGDSKGVWISKVRVITPVNTNGAGDAFMAGIMYGELNGFTTYRMVQFASACAGLTIQHKNAVHPDLSADRILKEI